MGGRRPPTVPARALAQVGLSGLVALADDVGPVFAIENGPVIVTGYADGSATADRRFISHIGGQLAALRPVLGEGLATAPTDSRAWHRGREVLVPAFTPQRLAASLPAFELAATNLVRTWATDGEHDVASDVMRTTLDGISQAVARCDWQGEWAEIPGVLHRSVMAAKEQRPVAESDVRMLRKLTSSLAATHQSAMSDTPDFLDQLLVGRTSEGEHLTPDEVHDQVVTLLVAGHETTGSLISFCLFELLVNPDVRDELQRQVRSSMSGVTLDSSTLSSVPLLDQVVRETLRLHSPAIALTLTPTENVTLPCGVEVLPGDEVLVLVDSVHRDSVWVDPHRFDPLRFASDRRSTVPHNGWIPFGFGPRTCIGRNVAMLHAATTLAVLLRDSDVHLADDQYVMRVSEGLTPLPDGLSVRASLRAGVSEGDEA